MMRKGQTMRSFKLKQGLTRIYTIDKETFEDLTLLKKPYYIPEKKYDVHFAVCPQCDNPIQIIGLYKKLKHTENPYGRHYPKSIEDLAAYNQQAYDFCPYARKKPRKIPPKALKANLTDYERNIYYTLRNQFDRVIYFIEQELDMRISKNFAKSMLEIYVGGNRWKYPGATPNNIPYMLWYLSWSKGLYKQRVKIGSDLYRAIEEKYSKVEFIPTRDNKYAFISNKPGTFVQITGRMAGHEQNITNDELRETITFIVAEYISKGKEKQIYKKVIKIEQSKFGDFVRAAGTAKYRDQKFLDIAKSIMPDI